MSRADRIFKHYTLKAGESDAEGLMPATLLASRVIEIATEHANMLGIGYATLITRNVGWVLSRLSMEVKRYPRINEPYSLSTWIESCNRRFSERNFELTGDNGEVLGHMRTVWVPMNFATRAVADLSEFGIESFPIADYPCPIAKAPRLTALPDDAETENYTFRYCDIDFNRHVNTVRYLDLILNHWTLEHYDRKMPARIDLMFHHECHFGETVELRVAADKTAPGERSLCEVVRAGGEKAVGAAIVWRPVEE